MKKGFFLFLFYKGENSSSERRNKLARVTELVSGGARIQTQVRLNQTQSPSPVLSPEYNQNQSDTRNLED